MERFVFYRERGHGGPRRACFRRRLRDRTVRRWQARFDDREIVVALDPRVGDWVGGHGVLTYRLI